MKRCLDRSGFTLVELIVVVAILSVVMVSALFGYNSFRDKARKVQVQAQLKKIQFAIENLALDTEQWPGPNPVGELASKNVWDLNAGAAGLVQANDDFDSWNGPYIDAIPKDPWVVVTVGAPSLQKTMYANLHKNPVERLSTYSRSQTFN